MQMKTFHRDCHIIVSWLPTARQNRLANECLTIKSLLLHTQNAKSVDHIQRG